MRKIIKYVSANMMWQEEVRSPLLPAEWALQSGIQLTWPHEGTDWAPMLEEVERCFTDIAREVARRERLLIVHPRPEEIRRRLADAALPMDRIRFEACETNDTWARDHGAITMLDVDGPSLLDFTFNGWGLKFAADKDNLITRQLVKGGCLKGTYANRLGFVLEGGSIESDGLMNQMEIEEYLRRTFHLQRVLWLNHGYLAGDDTDSHVDTLARFCDPETIAYVKCSDPDDEHYAELSLMEEELKALRTADVLREAFPGREITGIDCRPLIKQHGSLHCVTMQYPAGVMTF